ncbi:MAG: LysR family transcriptional regulator [Geminicoccaceae bacterium]|nr:LysR family transcriptional regulator [Geminicoccaceae bacterium]
MRYADLPPLATLRVLEAAVRLGSFTAAADELGRTQSAISHQIKELELRLGCPLFERRGRGVVATAEGERLAEAVIGGLGRIHHAFDALRRERRADRVVVSALPGFVVKWLFPRLVRFDERHPAIEVDVMASGRRSELVAGEADLAIRYGSGSYPGLGSTLLLGERMAPACAPRLARQLREPADLAAMTLLHDDLPTGEGVGVGWARWLAAVGLGGLEPAHNRRFGQSNMVIDAAVEGVGVALGRSPLVAGDIRAGRLVVPFGPALATGLAYHIVGVERVLERPAVCAFIDWLVEEARAEPAPEVILAPNGLAPAGAHSS